MKQSSTVEIKSDELKRLRLEAFLERPELAEKAGLSDGRLKAMENGSHVSTTVTSVRKLAEVLGCEPSDIAEVTTVEVAS